MNSNTSRFQNIIQIKFIDYAIAFRIGDIIYLNRQLKCYPELFKAIIRHEKAHTNGFTLKDVKIDLKGSYLRNVKKDYYKFIMKNPKSWLQFSPILKTDGKWSWDLIMLGLWLLFLTILTILIKITNLLLI